MENTDEALKTVALTLEKYKKNKTMVPPEDLKGKYKVPFENLVNQLREELSDFVSAYCFHGLIIRKCDEPELMKEINQAFEDSGVGKAIGCAAFKNFDLEEVKRIAEETRQRVYQIWKAYFHRHTCLYAYGQCFAEDKPHTPLIYNKLVDKFWDEQTEMWIHREKPEGDAILIFIGGETA